MTQAQQQTMQADPMLVRCLTLHQTVLEHSAHGLTKEEIYQRVDGYAGRYREAQFLHDEARERELAALERRFSSDKQYLRGAGIPLEESEDLTGEHRYRIRTEEYGLPDLQLSELERLALHHAQLQFATSSIRGLQHAVWALNGAAGPGTAAAPAVVQASIGSETELDQLLDISLTGLRTPIGFSYTGRGRSQSQPRRTIPLALGGRGHWYLIAYDLDRAAQRVFRLDRIQGGVEALAPQQLSSEERALAKEIAEGTRFTDTDTEAILAGMEAHQEYRAGLEAVIEAHRGQAPAPGRLRPAGLRAGKDNIGLKTDRVINMTAYLLSSSGVPPSRLLTEYGITAEQLHRDLLSIEQSGPNVGMSRYVNVEPQLPLERGAFEGEYLSADEPITLTMPEGASTEPMHRPVSLTKPGALSLLIALKALIQMLPAEQSHLRQAARSVKHKVLSIVPPAIASAAGSLTMQRVESDSATLDIIDEALSGDYAVALEYTDAAGAATQRTVEPAHVLYDGPHAYLHAWCQEAVGERLFRVDRIRSVTPLPTSPRSSNAHTLDKAPAAPQTAEKTGDSVHGVVLRFVPFAAAAAQRFAPELQRRDSADGSVFIRTHFRSPQTVINTCIEAGGDIEVVQPPSLRHQVLQEAQQRLAALDSDSSTVG